MVCLEVGRFVVGRASRIVVSAPIRLSPSYNPSHNTLYTGNRQRHGGEWHDFNPTKPTTARVRTQSLSCSSNADRRALPSPHPDALLDVQNPDQIQDLELLDDADVSGSRSRHGDHSNASSSTGSRQQHQQQQQQQQEQKQRSVDIGTGDAMSMSNGRDKSALSPPRRNKPESSHGRSPLAGILHPAASPPSSPVGPAEPLESREPAVGVSPASKDATVLYSRYSFLAVGNLHSIPQQDVNYLESQGCLHVPTRPYLDSFMEHYFLHVHVFISVLNEGDFWDMYYQNETPGGSKEKMSLLLFQSMLFAASNVNIVCPSSI